MNDLRMLREAAAFAARAHRGQLRKDGCTPYFAHCARVALTVSAVFGENDPATLAAALLHDTLEDCGADFDELEERFGREVAAIVACLSKDARLPEAQREAAYDRQLAAGPWEARLIKLADAIDNVQEAGDEASRARAIRRAQRALSLAAGEARLDAARKALIAVMRRMGVAARGARAGVVAGARAGAARGARPGAGAEPAAPRRKTAAR
jgi:guanosine-3',5'-bis(diphosphate) 3'-pyrophosphohydrolase